MPDNSRKTREHNCKLVALGCLLSIPSALKSIVPADYDGVPGLSALIENLQSVTAKNQESLGRVHEWMLKYLGVEPNGDEKLNQAVLRTVHENATRDKLSHLLGVLSLQSSNPKCGDAAFIRQVKERIAEIEL